MNIDIALPHELTLEQNRRLIQDFVREQFMRKGYAAHVAIHAPDPHGDPRNIHAHVLVSLRKIGPEGFARTKAEQQERYRNRGAFVDQLRQKWETLANRHLARNGIDARIDRRSLDEQGMNRKPEQHRGPALTAMERRGQVTRTGSESGHHLALPVDEQPPPCTAPEPPAAPEAIVPISTPQQTAEPSCAPERDDDVEVLPPPATPAAAPSTFEAEPRIFGGEFSCAIDAAPVMAPPAIADEIPDQSPGATGDVVAAAEPRAPPRTLGGAIKTLFRAAVKAVLRRVVEAAPQPKRNRKGETEGEFRRLARRCSRRYDARADFKGRTAILSRSFSIPAEVYSMAAAHVSALLNDLNNDGGSDFDDGIDAAREYISPQP